MVSKMSFLLRNGVFGCTFLVYVLLLNAGAQTPNTLPYTPPKTIIQLVDMVEKEEIVLIDVRTPAEFEQGHLEGAVLIEYQLIEQEIAKYIMDKDKPIALYCRSGRRSGIAAAALTAQGYRNVLDIGAYEALKQAGYPVLEP